ncbi:MAG: aminomethyl-transferring glycine dehydrogenase [Firmicutes bacterium HGW-Firmicutes-9]|nr:MAG: aminomethyl-transferring glycine dehydrogenase [Firmicutes bacterium HGW-Firmicutes-9]
MGNFLPSTDAQRREMMDAVGVSTIEELYTDIPADLRQLAAEAVASLPEGVSEFEALEQMKQLAKKNRVFDAIFRGAGAYWHYVPAVVSRVAAKEAFVTAYTPYQPEISQGILQTIFEYQTMLCELTGMDAGNASVYDGATAAAEAAAMCRERNRSLTLLAAGLNPESVETVKTYSFGADVEYAIVPNKAGRLDLDALKAALNAGVASLILQSPNYFGVIEDVPAIAELVHAAGAKLVVSMNPTAMALLASPGEMGADVAIGDGQPLGIPLSFGGPYLGFMACKKDMVRKLPGRIVGQTTDAAGRRCFVLTLQAREQHIRREKASSNICSNQALCALTAAAYCAAMGPAGMTEVARACYDNAHYLASELGKIKGFALVNPEAPFFHEFLTQAPANTDQVLKALEDAGILGGLPVNGGILWCATERNTKAQMDKLIETVKAVIA